jgi:DMSO/TMAO reductase YedYZ molybdopterin-dependent catalytic subunit
MSTSENLYKSIGMALAFALALAFPCARGEERPKAQTVEVREYKGEKLDPIAKFEENSIRGPQHVDIGRYKLEITGVVERPARLTYEQVLARPALSRVTVVHCVEGWDVKVLWEGVSIPDLLKESGVGSRARTVIFRSADGYSTSLPLADVMKKNMLLAYRMNGLTLPEERGFPFQVVAEDKWGYKWAKWVTRIELSDKTDYRGYWESRGYNNDGDLSGPIYEIR